MDSTPTETSGRVTLSSSRPDVALLERLAVFRNLLVSLVILVTVVIAGGWLFAPFGHLLPVGWSLMKFNSALCLLLSSAAIILSRPGQSTASVTIGRIIAGVVSLIASIALYEHLSGNDVGIDTLIAADPSPLHPGRMSIQTSMFLCIQGIVLIFARARKSRVSHLVDVMTLFLLVLVLVIFAGYCFGASNLFGESASIQTSPQTLFCMVLLTAVTLGRRADYGYFSVLIGVGIGSRVTRLMLPIALLLPFILVIGGAYSTYLGWLSPPYAAALTAATISSLLFCVLISLGWRINGLESELRDMSLTDELTQIYNRRGFQLLGQQALLEARRGGDPLSILYFDLDGLKQINDQLGHDVGSELVRDMASLLKTVFRAADIVARVGGDEFAVVAHADNAGARVAMRRLEDATSTLNQEVGRRYRISYSAGESLFDLASDESFSAVVNRADAQMYLQKRAKKLQQHRV